MQIEVVGLKKLDAEASCGGGKLLGDGVHGVPKACESEAIVGVHSPGRSVILETTIETDLCFFFYILRKIAMVFESEKRRLGV